LVANNLSSIALQEATSLFSQAPNPSLLLSVGSGSSLEEKQPACKSKGEPQDYFPFRLAQAFQAPGSNKNAWQRLVAHKKVG
jgi:hypothetical protein